MLSLKDALLQRRSIRWFKTDAIDRKTLEEVLDLARWSPSWGNTQPWRFFIFQGEPLEKLRELSVQRVRSGEPFHPEVPMPSSWPEELKHRYSETGRLVFSALNIDREDRQRRNEFYLEMARFFGAPCLIVGTLPRAVAIEYAMLDMGIAIQSICLAAVAYGLGTCIMAASVGYPDILRKIGKIDDHLRIIMGIAVGYAADNPVNRFSRPRLSLEEMVTWVE